MRSSSAHSQFRECKPRGIASLLTEPKAQRVYTMSATSTVTAKSAASQFATATLALIGAWRLAKTEKGIKGQRAIDRVRCDACTLIAAAMVDSSLASASITVQAVTVTRGEEVIALLTCPALAACKAVAFSGALQGASKLHAPKA